MNGTFDHGSPVRALGKRLTPQELSSAEMQHANGGIELLVGDEPYDMLDVIHALFDAESFLHLRAPFAPAVVVGFARLGGRSIGILATNPKHDGGTIDEFGAQKISRHIELCNAWQLPIVSLIDTQGTCTRFVAKDKTVTREPGPSRMHARCSYAMAEASRLHY